MAFRGEEKQVRTETFTVGSGATLPTPRLRRRHQDRIELPLLLIDDEADNASVDTGEQKFDEDGNPDEEHQPKAINRLVRQILNSFSRSAYVGYTATPFANIFIHRTGETKDEGPDLFPPFHQQYRRAFELRGPARVFG